MYVDGVGERPVIDSGGFPVVWNGAPCQDPAEGGTNCYGPGDVLYDADTGAAYQIGSDLHLRTTGDQPSSSPAPSAPAATVTDHFYYVDHGSVIEKTVYSDGSSTFADTGLQSPLADGTTSGDPYSLANAATPAAGTPTSSSDTGGGFQTANPGGGYGPYATPAPPVLRDLGTYVDGGRIIDHQVDQYGNDYYTDVGAAPAVAAPSVPIRQTPAPTVPTVRAAAPTVYAVGASRLPSAPTTTYTPPVLGPTTGGATIPGQSPVGPRVSPHDPAWPTAAITATGNPTQFGHQVVTWLTRADFIGGVPNGLLAIGGLIGARMLRNRRRF